MGGRVVEGTSLENWRRATYRGFESHPIRSFLLPHTYGCVTKDDALIIEAG